MKTMIKTLALCLVTLFTSMASLTAWSEVAVIVNPSVAGDISESDIKRIFLGKKKSFPGGGEVIPIDQKEGSSAKVSFVTTALGKNEQQMKAYWAQRLFTGKGTPPKVVDTDAEVKKLVSENPAVIGYIDASAADGSVKVVKTF